MIKVGIRELNPMHIFMKAEHNNPMLMICLALYLSPRTPKKHLPKPYNPAAIDITIPISDFV
jgi:hypothetical protein